MAMHFEHFKPYELHILELELKEDSCIDKGLAEAQQVANEHQCTVKVRYWYLGQWGGSTILPTGKNSSNPIFGDIL